MKPLKKFLEDERLTVIELENLISAKKALRMAILTDILNEEEKPYRVMVMQRNFEGLYEYPETDDFIFIETRDGKNFQAKIAKGEKGEDGAYRFPTNQKDV